MESAVGKKKKLRIFKLENLKLEIFHLSWKVQIKVAKFSVLIDEKAKSLFRQGKQFMDGPVFFNESDIGFKPIEITLKRLLFNRGALELDPPGYKGPPQMRAS